MGPIMRFAVQQAFCNSDGAKHSAFVGEAVRGDGEKSPNVQTYPGLRAGFAENPWHSTCDSFQFRHSYRIDVAIDRGKVRVNMNLGTRGALTFRLGEFSFAVRVEEAGGVLDAERLAHLPCVAEPIAGVAAFRGEMVPVVDLAAYLGIETHGLPGPRYALVLARGVDRFALLIPEIPKLVPGRELREAPASAVDPELGELLESELETDQDHFHLLNYWKIFESMIPVGGAASPGRSSVERGN